MKLNLMNTAGEAYATAQRIWMIPFALFEMAVSIVVWVAKGELTQLGGVR